MNSLKNSRKIIDKTDKKMAKLFQKRMNAVKTVAKYKAENNIEIEDLSREAKIIDRNKSYIKNAELIPYYTEFLKKNIELSKQLQFEILNNKAGDKFEN